MWSLFRKPILSDALKNGAITLFRRIALVPMASMGFAAIMPSQGLKSANISILQPKIGLIYGLELF